MNKILLTLLISFSLSGCFYQSVNSNDIDTAVAICAKDQATVIEISATYAGTEYVTCSNRKALPIINR